MLEFAGVLLQNWKYVVATILIVGALAYAAVLRHEVNTVTSQNTSLTKQVTELQTTNKDMQAVYEQRVNNLSNAINTQNKDITAYQEQIAALTKSIQAANQQANTVRATYDNAAQKILTDSSIGDATTCQDTITYLVQGVSDLKWDTK